MSVERQGGRIQRSGGSREVEVGGGREKWGVDSNKCGGTEEEKWRGVEICEAEGCRDK